MHLPAFGRAGSARPAERQPLHATPPPPPPRRFCRESRASWASGASLSLSRSLSLSLTLTLTVSAPQQCALRNARGTYHSPRLNNLSVTAKLAVSQQGEALAQSPRPCSTVPLECMQPTRFSSVYARTRCSINQPINQSSSLLEAKALAAAPRTNAEDPPGSTEPHAAFGMLPIQRAGAYRLQGPLALQARRARRSRGR